MELTSTQIGYFFAIMPIFYMLSGYLIQYIPTRIDNKVVMIIAIFGNSLGLLLAGPSQILFLPK
jgi:uncharacterized membrane protein